MKADDYQQLAARTECDQVKSLSRYVRTLTPIRLNHAVIGAMGELGELAGAVERWLHYGQKLDRVNVIEELGDLLWYVAEACNALQIPMSAVMEGNIKKLKKRFPEHYSDLAALESNRDRKAEAEAVESVVGKGLEENPPRLPIQLRDESTTTFPQETLVAAVLRARNTIQGCCERFADRKGCDCLERAKAQDADDSLRRRRSLCGGNDYTGGE